MAREPSLGEPLLELPRPLSARGRQPFRVGIGNAIDGGLSFLRHREVYQRLVAGGGVCLAYGDNERVGTQAARR